MHVYFELNYYFFCFLEQITILYVTDVVVLFNLCVYTHLWTINVGVILYVPVQFASRTLYLCDYCFNESFVFSIYCIV